MAWYDPDWWYRKPLVLTGAESGEQTDFQVDIEVSHAATKMQTDFGDIRFTQSDGTTLIDAWLESKVDDTSATIWAEFPTTPANTVEQTYYMYYGNELTASNWDIGATFLFGDDFVRSNSDTVGNGWTEGHDGSWSIDTNRLKGVWASGYNYNKCAHAFTPTCDVAYHSKYQVDNTNQNWYMSVYPEVANRYMAFLDRNTADINYLNSADWQVSENTYVADTYYEHIIKYNQSSGKVTYELPDFSWSSGEQDPYTPDATTNEISFISGYSTRTMYCDWLFARKWVANPPTYEFGSEECGSPTRMVYQGKYNTYKFNGVKVILDDVVENAAWYYNMLRRRN